VAKLIEVLQSTVNVSTVHANVQALKRSGSSWLALDASNTVLAQARVAVVANAYDSIGLLKRSGLESSLAACRRLPALHRLAGQVTLIPSDALAGGPRCVVGGNGYVLPAVDNWCVSGGTYERGVELAACTPAGRRANVARAGEILGLEQLPPSDGLPGWAGWRAVLPGRLPAIGALPGSTDLWVFTAGASRGLTWSVLGATLIRNALIGQTSPLGPDLLAQIEL
jgi:tRNA 5-methylaminomethyl-2-thiouridine biosynthesis bifunctional protein